VLVAFRDDGNKECLIPARAIMRKWVCNFFSLAIEEPDYFTLLQSGYASIYGTG